MTCNKATAVKEENTSNMFHHNMELVGDLVLPCHLRLIVYEYYTSLALNFYTWLHMIEIIQINFNI